MKVEYHCVLSDGLHTGVHLWVSMESIMSIMSIMLPTSLARESLILEKNVNFTQLRCFKDVCTLGRL